MSDTSANKKELLAELLRLRARVTDLEQSRDRDQDQARHEMNRALSLMPVVVYTCGPSPNHPTTSISGSVEQLLGYTAQQFYDHSKFWEDRIHPDDVDRVLDRLGKIEQTNHCSYEYRFRNAAGAYRWLDDRVSVHRDSHGNVVGLVGSWFDVTDRKQAEDKLVASEERFRAIAVNLPGAVFSYDVDQESNRTAIYVGPGFSDLIGQEVADQSMKGDVDSFFERIHPEDMERLKKTGQFDPSFSDPIDQEYRLRDEAGMYRWVRVIARPTQRDHGVQRWHGLLFDVTQQKEAEQKFQESEKRYRELFDRVPVGLYRSTPSGTILEANPALVRMLGYPDRDSLLRTNVRSLYSHKEDRNRLIEEADRDGVVMDVEFKARRLNGEQIWVRANTRTVRDSNGSVLFYEGSLEDITSRKKAESSLREERDRAQTYLDTFGAIMVAVDSQQKVTLINKRGCEILGVSERDIVGVNWFDTFIPTGERDKVREGFELLMAGDEEIMEYFENSIVTSKGAERVIAWRNSVLRDDEGDIIAVLGSGVDITDRRQAEEALRQSEERARQQLLELDTLYRTAPVGLCLMDTELRYVRINEQLAQINGPSVQDHIGRTIHEVIPELAPTIEPLHKKVVETGEPILGVEVHGVTPAQPGVERQWLISYAPLKTDEGEVLGINTVVSDITESKQIEERLRRYEHIVSTTSDHMSFVDSNYVYRTVNDSYLNAHRRSREEIIGRSIAEILGDDVFEKTVKPRFDRCLAGEPLHYQAWFNFRGTGRLFMDVVYSPHRDDNGDITGVTVSARDITERKRAEDAQERLEAQLRQSQKLQAIGQLAAGVSHDFNSLLTVILGHAELMLSRRRQGGESDYKKDMVALQQIIDAVERGGSVVKKLLTFGRTQKFRPQPLNLNQIIEAMATLLHGLAGEKTSITLSLEPDLATISADAGQLEQIVMNLIINARDAMPTGGELTIETANISEEHLVARGHDDRTGDHVMLAINDSGEGMSRETLERLFEPFFTTKPLDKGSGLGLSIVHGIVEQSGGVIDVESKLGSGSVFRLYFPAVR